MIFSLIGVLFEPHFGQTVFVLIILSSVFFALFGIPCPLISVSEIKGHSKKWRHLYIGYELVADVSMFDLA